MFQYKFKSSGGDHSQGGVGLSRAKKGEPPDGPFCSQTAHDQNVLGQCAQSRATLATPLNGGRGNWKILVERAQWATGSSPPVKHVALLSMLC